MKKIEIHQSFEEQEQAQLAFYASLSHEESMNLFFRLMKLSKGLKEKSDLPPKRKIEIKHDTRF